jgi:ADP-heptose:LPS heptosyltransferase
VQQLKHILVIRFSAMGDVAMTVPVIKNLLQQYPDIHITFVSNAFFAPLFEGLERVNFHPAYLKDQHKGIPGLYRLYKELKKDNKFEAIIDLHNVLRSQITRTFFQLAGYKVAVIDKGREEKKELTRKENKVLHQLSSTHERYATVFRETGFDFKLNTVEPVYSKQSLPSSVQSIFDEGKKVIGIAPFAQHKEKMYPLEKMKEVVTSLSMNNNVLLFGGGQYETAILQQWEKEIKNVFAVAGKFSFKEELAIISSLHIMLSMDSANMHLASLYKIPVISVWGATHPFAGFYGWAQNENNIVQVDLECRPCSVFGNKPCFRGDNACMHMITTNRIIQKINGLL